MIIFLDLQIMRAEQDKKLQTAAKTGMWNDETVNEEF